MRVMIVPDPAFSVGMVHAPIATLIVVGHDIDGGDEKISQVRSPPPFQDHEGKRKRGLL